MQYIIRSFTLHSSSEECYSAQDSDPNVTSFDYGVEKDIPLHLFVTYAMDPSAKAMWKCDWNSLFESGIKKGIWSLMEPQDGSKDDRKVGFISKGSKPLSDIGMEPRKFAVIIREENNIDEVKQWGTSTPKKRSSNRIGRPKISKSVASKPKKQKVKTARVRPQAQPDEAASSESDDDGEEEQSDYSDQEDAEVTSDEEMESESEIESEPESDLDEFALRTPSKRKFNGSSTSTPSKRRAGPSSATSTPRSGSTLFTPKSSSRKQVLDKYTSIPALPARPPKLSSFSAQELKTLSPIERAKRLLHVGATPDQLVCREQEYYEIFNQVQGAVNEGSGSCVYVSGVPGTGKTATVRAVVRALHRSAQLGEMDPFTFVEINGMKLPDANQSYSLLWSAISGGQRTPPKQSLANLTSHFGKMGSKGAPMGVGRDATVVLMDEMDQLVTGRQDVMYNLFNWPNTHGSKLIVIAVANTFDLPERLLSPKVLSRLGMHRIQFHPYQATQLEVIVKSRLGIDQQEKETEVEIGEIDKAAVQGCAELFIPAAIQLASKRVAGVSGDARRMLDSCRRALEMVEEVSISTGKQMKAVTAMDMTEIFKNIVKSGKVAHIHALSFHAKLLLGSILKVFQIQGKPEIDVADVLIQHGQFCTSKDHQRSRFIGSNPEVKKVAKFSNEEMSRLLARLSGLGLIVPVGVGCGPARAGGHARIMLACDEADIRLAMGGGDEKSNSDPRLRQLF